MNQRAKIRLTVDLPISPKHGCLKGEEFIGEFEYAERARGANDPIKFLAKDGAQTKAFKHEYEVIEYLDEGQLTLENSNDR